MEKNDKSVILVVDDKPANILVLENLLAAKDRVFLNATSGEDALKITLNEDIDLMILDVQMPGMDGFEVARILKSNERTKNIPIIFATAENKELKLMMKGYDEGAIDYFFKPLDPDIVRAKVTVLLKIQLQKKELVEKNLSLEKIRNYLTTVARQSTDAIYIHDYEGKIISWNEGAEKIYGYPESDALKMKIWNIIPEYMANEMENILGNILNGKKVNTVETKRITKHGKVIDVLFSAAVVIDSGSDLKSVVITERDITGQKIAEEQIRQLNAHLQANVMQLEATNKELESFSYSVSHDLRSPLRALSGYSKMILEDYADRLDKEGKRLLGNIQDNVKKMGMLIEDLLAFSKLGKKEVKKWKINMEQMVEDILIEINRSTKHNAKIKMNLLYQADADHTLLNQVWVNLISNAIKYSGKKENPEIEIGSADSEAEIIYFVKDNGSGFDMKYADKLFGVFQRLHNHNEFEGTGVGLAIVHRIITKHGGRIWADSKLNEGATFYFTIPKINRDKK